MIYSASLNLPVKQAYQKNTQQSTVSRITDIMSLDPETTNMDVVILGPRDCAGPKGAKLQQAVAHKHPDVCVIYIYSKDAEKDLLDCKHKFFAKKITEKTITDAYMEFVKDHQIKAGKGQVTSADFKNPYPNGDDFEDDEFEDVIPEGSKAPIPTSMSVNTVPLPAPMPPVDDVPVPPTMSNAPTWEDEEPTSPAPVFPDGVLEPEPAPAPIPRPMDTAPVLPPNPQPTEKIEDVLAKVRNYEDWQIFKENLRKDSVVRKLIEENSEYIGLKNMIDVLDRRIETVWRDTSLSPEQKFDKIKEIGLEKSSAHAAKNSIDVEKIIKIINAIMMSAKRAVEEKLASVDAAMCKMVVDRNALSDTSYIDRAIDERMKVQTDLLRISRDIVDIYKSIDSLVKDEISDLDAKLPSSSEFINDMVKPIGMQIFTPQNTAALTNKLMRALQDNKVVASQMEESVNAVIDTLFELCDKDEEILRYQANLIDMLKAHRVEDVIITDSVIKKCLRLYVGADNSGRSSTALTWCGILSRRQNSLLIDLTGRDKFREYGITPVRLDDFLNRRQETQFLCVASDSILGPEKLQELVENLKSRLNYYPYVNIILAPEDYAGLEQLSNDALCVHYITNCSSSSIDVMRDVVARHKTENIARKLVVIDTPVSPLMIADNIGVDPTLVKIVTLPNVPAVRACALRHDRPYEFSDVVQLYEEAFR